MRPGEMIMIETFYAIIYFGLGAFFGCICCLIPLRRDLKKTYNKGYSDGWNKAIELSIPRIEHASDHNYMHSSYGTPSYEQNYGPIHSNYGRTDREI